MINRIMNIEYKQLYNIIISMINILICVIVLVFKLYNNTFLGILLLALNLYMLIKYRKNKLLFFAMIIIVYFNFSFVITKYIGTPIELLQGVYNQISNSDTMTIGITALIICFSILNIVIGNVNNIDNKPSLQPSKVTIANRNKIVLILQVLLTLILLYHIIAGITHNTTLLEYSIFLFIFAFYYSKGNKTNKIILEILLMFFAIYSLKNGDRISVLQFLLADFIINYLDKFTIKKMIACLIIGITIFTFAGVYGDFLEYGQDLKDLSIRYAVDKFMERRMALDTSISAYFSGLSMIDVSNKYTIEERIKNGIEYFTSYTLLGSKSNYTSLDLEIRKYQINYGGGLPTCYFYFWGGWLGVVLFSLYLGKLLKIAKEKDNPGKSDYVKLLSIFIVATIPRWYLYAPTLLFRGVIIFSIIYLGIFLLSNVKLNIKYLMQNKK